MVVIHRAYGFRFVIYTSDDKPAHIHITGPGQAKIDLFGPDGGVKLVYSIGIKRADMRRLLAETLLNREAFLEEWEGIHGQPER